MKTTIQILTAFALASTIGLAEGDRKPQGAEGPHRHKPNPAKILEHLDKDGNGSVSKEEFLASERGQKDPERAAKVFAHIDENNDGALTTNEFAKMRRPGGPGEGDGEGRDRPNPAEIFKRLDKDGSGSISKEEFTSGERAQKNPEMAAKMFQKLDADGDGSITHDEFAKRPRPDDHKPGEGRPNGGERPRKPKGNDAGGANIE